MWKHLRNYFRMSRPGFEITSNADVLNHGVGEFCLTTDTAQGMQFYKQGNMKTKSNKSTELYAGFDSSRDDLAVGIHAENGVIYIRAVNGDLVLQGKNVKIDANDPQGTVSINANKETKTYHLASAKELNDCIEDTKELLLELGFLQAHTAKQEWQK